MTRLRDWKEAISKQKWLFQVMGHNNEERKVHFHQLGLRYFVPCYHLLSSRKEEIGNYVIIVYNDYREKYCRITDDDDKGLPLRPCLQSTCSLQRIRIDTPRRRRPTFCVINFSFAAQLCDTDKSPFDSLPCILSLQINPFVSLEAFLWGWSALYAFKCCT